jgi:phosphatidylglycerophosphate synthase
LKYRFKNLGMVITGSALIAAGWILLKSMHEPQAVLRTLPYVCIGLGCGVFGHGMGNLISLNALKKHPAIQRQIEIEKNDERNVEISNRAKAKAYDMMLFVFGAVLFSFALMGTDMAAIILLVIAYLFIVFSGIYYRYKYNKEM